MNKKKAFHLDFAKYGMIIALVVITIIFQILTKGVLLAPMNIAKLIMQNGYILILAVGMLPVILTGDIDLSVGAIMAFVGAIMGKMMVGTGTFPVGVAIIFGLVIGLLIGAIQGFWIAFVRVPAFIATLAGMLIFRGLTLVITAGKTLGPFPDSYQYIAQAYLPDIGGPEGLHTTTLLIGILLIIVYIAMSITKRKQQIKYGFKTSTTPAFIAVTIIISLVIAVAAYWFMRFKGAPFILVILGVLVIIYSFITQKTVIGRHIYALGGNERASELSGIKIRWVKFGVFANMGLMAAIAGIVYSARINCASPTAGDGFEMDAIASCFIGGASSSGGIGTVTGAIIGGLVMGVLNNGMSIVGVGTDWQKTIKGCVLLLAVVFDIVNQSKRK